MGIPFYKRKLRVTFLFFKKQAERKKYQACVSPFFFFSFYHFRVQKMGEREMTTAGPPAPSGEQQRGTKRILSTASFFFFRCRGAATGVAGAVKVAPRGHAEGTSRPPFPKLPPEKKFFFFTTLHGYIATASQTASQTTSLSKRRKKKTFVSCTRFTVPEWLQKCSFFPLFLSLSHQIVP